MPLRLLRSQTTSTWTEGAIEGTKRCYNILFRFSLQLYRQYCAHLCVVSKICGKRALVDSLMIT